MSAGTYPDTLEIQPLARPPKTSVRVPGSKSITNRALVLAALSGQVGCELRGILRSEDTEMMIGCLDALGFLVETRWSESRVRIYREEGDRIGLIPAHEADLFVGNSGTTMRFLTAMVSLGQGRYRLDGIPRMRERPIQDLLDALHQVGVDARSEQGNGCPPISVRSQGWQRNELRVRGDASSQFLSGLMMAAVRSQRDERFVTIHIDGPLVSVPYVHMTLDMMEDWGIDVGFSEKRTIAIDTHWPQSPGIYTIEPDASSASYFWAAAAVTGGDVGVNGLTAKSLQGDVRFVDCLERMGCDIIRDDAGITVRGGELHGIDVDMNDISDTVMTLAAVACFADGPTTIRNVAHIRHKETDRLAALATELRRLGAEVDEFADGLTITPRPLHGAEVETYNDHRMAMSLALIGLRVPGVVIKNPGCVVKTYPDFWRDLERLRQTDTTV